MKTFKQTFLALAVLVVNFSAVCFAQQNLSDWVIRDFEAEITVNKDSSLLIVEKITADCGSLPDKHGIFRVLPTQAKTEKAVFKNPVSLISVTDFSGKKIPYSESRDNWNHTVTLKIGDPDVVVSGLNYYKITYAVKNAVRAGNSDFDELYWNLSGNFWTIMIQNFKAKIILPAAINSNNSHVDYYTGIAGQKGKDMAGYSWLGNVLEFTANQALYPGQGVTASVTFPKGIFTPYRPGFFELYGGYFWFLVPMFVFIACCRVWNKYGKDPRVDKTIVPEFEIPQNLTPLEMGLLRSQGSLENKHISAAIVSLAVKKYLTIEEIKKSWILGGNDYKLAKTSESGGVVLSAGELALVDALFSGASDVLLSSLKKKFYRDIPTIKKAGISDLSQKGWFIAQSLLARGLFFIPVLAFGAFFFVAIGNSYIEAAIAFGASAAICLFFSIFMPKRTPAGAELNWRIKGFKLYMETAEKYRSRFNERENIFEKFLPYAIMFGIAKLWAQKMEEIYGKQYFANYHPAWYAGAFAGNFNADSFSSQMSAISAGIASNIGTSSGAHGAGGAGGGGGGGGGGGW